MLYTVRIDAHHEYPPGWLCMSTNRKLVRKVRAHDLASHFATRFDAQQVADHWSSHWPGLLTVTDCHCDPA